MVTSPATAPGGDWTVNYEGTDFVFAGVTDPQASARLIVPVPTFTQASGSLSQLGWAYMDADGAPLSGPPDFVRTLRIQILNPCGAVLHDSPPLDPATTSRTLSPPVNLASVAEVRFLYTDDLDNIFRVRFGAATPGGCKVVEFSAPSYSAQENVTPANIIVRRVGDMTGTVTVHVVAGNGTATDGEDYTAGDQVLTFGPNVTQLVRPVVILNNGTPEGPETVILTLQSPGGGATIGPLGTAVLTINDEDPRVRFSAATFNVTEGGSPSATITVERTGATGPVVSVPYGTSDGTAVAGVDYLATTGVLTFTAGQTSKTFTVPILNDALAEGTQTVNLALGTPIGAALASPSTAVLNISDTDAPATFAFAQAAFTGAESGGSVLITVTRTGSTGGNLTVRYETADGTGIEGTDYLQASGTLLFGPGEPSKTFAVAVLPNHGSSANRSVLLQLLDPSPGSQLGALSVATLWIVNEDP